MIITNSDFLRYGREDTIVKHLIWLAEHDALKVHSFDKEEILRVLELCKELVGKNHFKLVEWEMEYDDGRTTAYAYCPTCGEWVNDGHELETICHNCGQSLAEERLEDD